MSQPFKLKQPIVPTLRFTTDMEMSELIAFVGDKAYVFFQQGGVFIVEPDAPDSGIELEDDDVLVYMAGELEVYTSEQFAMYFEPFEMGV